MNRFVKPLTTLVWLSLAATAFPQAPRTDHLTVPFSDASRPGIVKVALISGSISVKGYSGKEVIVDAACCGKGEQEERVRNRAPRPEAEGLKRIPNITTGLTVEEDNNIVSIRPNPPHRRFDITLQVPMRTSLTLKTIHGDIEVEHAQGELEVSCNNGEVTLAQISGSVVAHSLNGKVKVGMTAVDSDKPMSFSSLNGDIDVSLPPDIKANLSMKSDNGEMYSDFDIKIDSQATQPAAEELRSQNGKYRIRADRTTRGTINGGGPELQFKTFNGNIYIRKSAR